MHRLVWTRAAPPTSTWRRGLAFQGVLCLREFRRAANDYRRDISLTRGIDAPKQAIPELMPVEIGPLSSTKLRRLVKACGFAPVWNVVQPRLLTGSVDEPGVESLHEDDAMNVKRSLALMRLGGLEEARQLARHLALLGADNELEMHNVLLNRLAVHGKDNDATWAEMQRRMFVMLKVGPRPDNASFVELFRFLARTQRPDRAKQVKSWEERARRHNKPLSQEVYVMLGEVALAHAKPGAVERLDVEMLEVHMPKPLAWLEVLLRARVAMGNVDGAAQLLPRIEKLNGSVTDASLHAIISAYLSLDRVGDAVQLYHRARAGGLVPSAPVYELLLSRLREQGRLTEGSYSQIDADYRRSVLKEGEFEENVRSILANRMLERTVRMRMEERRKRRMSVQQVGRGVVRQSHKMNARERQ